jgi:dTDP-4-amino-4,6-dideoxy-D-galactose acyltransferase
MKTLFVFNDQINDYSKEVGLAFIRLSVERPVERIELSLLTISLLKSKEIAIVIGDQIPMKWIEILKEMHIVSLVFGESLEYHHKGDIVIDFKGTDSAKYFSGEFFSMNNSDFNFEEVSSLVYQMTWDSNFFGFPIAFIGSRYLSENIQNFTDQFVIKNKIKLIEYLCNCHDDLSVHVAEKSGFHFTDIRITFVLNLQKHTVNPSEGHMIGLAGENHIKSLKLSTHDMYKDSRYFYDGNFELDKINSFYSEWIEKAVLGKFDHECYCIFENNQPIAFCTIRYNKNTASIGLFGVTNGFAGMGLGKILLDDVVFRMKQKGLTQIFVVTQGRNYGAQRLYQSAGFRTFSTELWYHKWIN